MLKLRSVLFLFLIKIALTPVLGRGVGLSIPELESKHENHAGWFQQVVSRPQPGLLPARSGFDYGSRGGRRGSILQL